MTTGNPARGAGPRRVPGTAHATSIVVVELLAGTRAYADTSRDAPPVVVIDTGPTELHLGLPGDCYALADLSVLDLLIEALAAYRIAVQAYLD